MNINCRKKNITIYSNPQYCQSQCLLKFNNKYIYILLIGILITYQLVSPIMKSYLKIFDLISNCIFLIIYVLCPLHINYYLNIYCEFYIIEVHSYKANYRIVFSHCTCTCNMRIYCLLIVHFIRHVFHMYCDLVLISHEPSAINIHITHVHVSCDTERNTLISFIDCNGALFVYIFYFCLEDSKYQIKFEFTNIIKFLIFSVSLFIGKQIEIVPYFFLRNNASILFLYINVIRHCSIKVICLRLNLIRYLTSYSKILSYIDTCIVILNVLTLSILTKYISIVDRNRGLRLPCGEGHASMQGDGCNDLMLGFNRLSIVVFGEIIADSTCKLKCNYNLICTILIDLIAIINNSLPFIIIILYIMYCYVKKTYEGLCQTSSIKLFGKLYDKGKVELVRNPRNLLFIYYLTEQIYFVYVGVCTKYTCVCTICVCVDVRARVIVMHTIIIVLIKIVISLFKDKGLWHQNTTLRDLIEMRSNDQISNSFFNLCSSENTKSIYFTLFKYICTLVVYTCIFVYDNSTVENIWHRLGLVIPFPIYIYKNLISYYLFIYDNHTRGGLYLQMNCSLLKIMINSIIIINLTCLRIENKDETPKMETLMIMISFSPYVSHRAKIDSLMISTFFALVIIKWKLYFLFFCMYMYVITTNAAFMLKLNSTMLIRSVYYYSVSTCNCILSQRIKIIACSVYATCKVQVRSHYWSKGNFQGGGDSVYYLHRLVYLNYTDYG